MSRLFLKISGYLAFAACFVSAVIDGVRSISAGALKLTATGDLLRMQLPEIRRLVSMIHPIVWDPLIYNLLRLPIWIVLGAIGLVMFTITLRRDKPDSFTGGEV